MAKILLVEDDNNLREIYEARLQAEGYDIVSAKDGEEALVVAKKERPDLIIADVMMPRVSGFEMLDIIRNTPELKAVPVIMLTALGQAEDKTRADSLGVDRYLVKSQVTLEDIVKAAADVLAGVPAGAPAAPTTAAPQPQTPPVTAATVPTPIATPPEPASVPPVPVPAPTVPQDATAPAQAPLNSPIPVTTPPAAIPSPPVTEGSAQPVPAPAAPPASTQDATTAIPEPSAVDSQLVTDAVNNLVAGTTTPQNTAVPPLPVPAVPATPVVPVPPAPQSPPVQTMQPVLTPPVSPIPAAPAAPAVSPSPPPPAPTPVDVTIPSDSTPARKAITPLPVGSTPSQPDLNELLAKEGHTMDETPSHTFGNPPHMPGNVITPGGPAPQSPPTQPPTDPSSISL